jgi:hypothetical protein
MQGGFPGQLDRLHFDEVADPQRVNGLDLFSRLDTGLRTDREGHLATI